MHALTIKGQVTLPAAMRRAVGLRPGDKVRFALKNGEIRLRPAAEPVRFPLFRVKRRHPTPEEIKQISADLAAARYLRAIGGAAKKQPRRGAAVKRGGKNVRR